VLVTDYIRSILKYLPDIVSLQDRDPASPTYGCLDREYWLSKSKEFPSGMYQGIVFGLALAYSYESDDNQYYKSEKLKNLILAGIEFLKNIIHSDGGLDDYFPNEKAFGTVAHVCFTVSETCRMLDLPVENYAVVDAMATFLLENSEAGTVSNHHAASMTALYSAYLYTGEKVYLDKSTEKKTELLSYFNDEGWFMEYDGADIGYQTMTMGYIAHYMRISEDTEMLSALSVAAGFCLSFIQPDMGYGGITSSRGTSHFNGYGFEVLRSLSGKSNFGTSFACDAFQKNEKMLKTDRFIGHQFMWLMLSAIENSKHVHEDFEYPKADCDVFYKDAGVGVRRMGEISLFISLNNGGSFKLYKNEKLIYAESALIISSDGKTLHTHTNDGYSYDDNTYTVHGQMKAKKYFNFSFWSFLSSRIVFKLAGKAFRDFIRKMAIKMLIQGGNKGSGISFEKTITLHPDCLEICWKCDGDDTGVDGIYLSDSFSSKTTSSGGYAEDIKHDIEMIDFSDVRQLPFEKTYKVTF